MRQSRLCYRRIIFCWLLAGILALQSTCVLAQERTFVLFEEETQTPADGSGLDSAIQAPSAVLMEPTTGTIIYEKNANEQLRPASITKIMTLILIFDALKDGTIKLEDPVTTSEYAASMGGSQVFLEPNEQQTVDTMIKCIAVASANDACVAYRDSRQIEQTL